MKIVGVIPARYASTRFPGKPLADIHGKPMIWWVYQQVRKVVQLDEVYVATDSNQIADVVNGFGGNVIMTGEHPDHISRIWEASEKINSDYYICVNGDEPLIDPAAISTVIQALRKTDTPYFGGAMRTLTVPSEVIDNAKIKLAISTNGQCIYMSRTPIPYPQGALAFDYKKYMGIECFNKSALDIYVSLPMGKLEKVEDIDHLRFIENGIPLYFTEVASEAISIDTPKDLEYVRTVIKAKAAEGEL